MAAASSRAGSGPGHGAQVGLFEKVGGFGYSSGNAETPQSPEHGWGCEDQVQLGGEG